MSAKRVLDVGNCGPDHHSLTMMVSRNFDGVSVDQAHQADDAVSLVNENDYSLVVVNRLLDRDGSQGMSVIAELKAAKPELPIMLVTNYQEHQDAAVAAGCVPGYGKNDLFSPTTVELFRGYLA